MRVTYLPPLAFECVCEKRFHNGSFDRKNAVTLRVLFLFDIQLSPSADRGSLEGVEIKLAAVPESAGCTVDDELQKEPIQDIELVTLPTQDSTRL